MDHWRTHPCLLASGNAVLGWAQRPTPRPSPRPRRAAPAGARGPDGGGQLWRAAGAVALLHVGSRPGPAAARHPQAHPQLRQLQGALCCALCCAVPCCAALCHAARALQPAPLPLPCADARPPRRPPAAPVLQHAIDGRAKRITTGFTSDAEAAAAHPPVRIPGPGRSGKGWAWRPPAAPALCFPPSPRASPRPLRFPPSGPAGGHPVGPAPCG